MLRRPSLLRPLATLLSHVFRRPWPSLSVCVCLCVALPSLPPFEIAAPRRRSPSLIGRHAQSDQTAQQKNEARPSSAFILQHHISTPHVPHVPHAEPRSRRDVRRAEAVDKAETRSVTAPNATPPPCHSTTTRSRSAGQNTTRAKQERAADKATPSPLSRPLPSISTTPTLLHRRQQRKKKEQRTRARVSASFFNTLPPRPTPSDRLPRTCRNTVRKTQGARQSLPHRHTATPPHRHTAR